MSCMVQKHQDADEPQFEVLGLVELFCLGTLKLDWKAELAFDPTLLFPLKKKQVIVWEVHIHHFSTAVIEWTAMAFVCFWCGFFFFLTVFQRKILNSTFH